MSTRLKAVLALIFANIIWGGASPIFKWSLTNIEPFTLAFFRFSLAALLLLPFVKKELFRIDWHDWPNILLFSFGGITFNIIFFFWGLKLASAMNAAIIATIQPIVLLFLGAIFLKENVQKIEIFGTLISFGGILIITLYPVLTAGYQDGQTILGNFFFILAMLGAVIGTFFSKKAFAKNKPLSLSFWAFLIATFSFLPLFLIEWRQNPGWLGQLTTPGIIGIVYGVFFSSALAYALYNYGLSKIEASETGIFNYLMLITAVLIAIPFFGEKLTWPFITGAILVVLGILLTERRLPFHPLYKQKKI